MIFDIIIYPDPVLRAPKFSPLPPTEISQETLRLVRGMRDTMFAAEALGIAAPQVGVLERIFLLDVEQISRIDRKAPLTEGPLVVINPEILETEGQISMQEGCLSLPSVYLNILRPQWVKMRAQTIHGETFELEATGMLARALLHEYDHLEGRLMFDHTNVLQRERAQKKVQRWRSEHRIGP